MTAVTANMVQFAHLGRVLNDLANLGDGLRYEPSYATHRIAFQELGFVFILNNYGSSLTVGDIFVLTDPAAALAKVKLKSDSAYNTIQPSGGELVLVRSSYSTAWAADGPWVGLLPKAIERLEARLARKVEERNEAQQQAARAAEAARRAKFQLAATAMNAIAETLQ